MNSKRVIYRMVHVFKSIFGEKITDDFDWKTYNIHYRAELQEIEKSRTLVLHNGDYVFKEDRLVKSNEKAADLHPNHHLLYETILQLKPDSVFELGCGAGDHLHNISVLSQNIKLSGFDLSERQLAFLKERHPGLTAEIRQYDCTLPFPHALRKVDIAYTQAVLMHIQTGNGHRVALANLFNMATKQVILMENWKRHDIVSDINELFSLEVMPWKNIYLYYRESEELKKPHLMVASSVPLSQYKILSDYKVLSENVYRQRADVTGSGNGADDERQGVFVCAGDKAQRIPENVSKGLSRVHPDSGHLGRSLLDAVSLALASVVFLLLPFSNPFAYSVFFRNMIPLRLAIPCAILAMILSVRVHAGSFSPFIRLMPRQPLLKGFLLSVSVFLAIQLATLAWSGDALRGFLLWTAWFSAVLFFWALVVSARTVPLFGKYSGSRAVAALFSASGIIAMVPLVAGMFAGGSPEIGKLHAILWYPEMTKGKAMYDTNVFANFLAMTAVCSVYAAMASKTKYAKALFWSAATLQTCLLFFSGSRSAMGAEIIALAIFSALRVTRKDYRAVFHSVLLLLAGFGAMFLFHPRYDLYHRMLPTAGGGGWRQWASVMESLDSVYKKPSSTRLHFMFLRSNMFLFSKQPWGVGLGGYGKAISKSSFAPNLVNESHDFLSLGYISPHSTWGAVLSETGLQGIVAYLLILGFLGYGLYVRWKSRGAGSTPPVDLCLTGLLGLHCSALIYYFNHEWFIFFMFICSIAAWENSADGMRPAGEEHSLKP